MGHNIKNLTKTHGWEAPTVTNEILQLSCLMRIADATEVMAQPFVEMIKEVEWLRSERQRLLQEVERLKNSRAGYKAAFTKLKNKEENEVSQ